MWGRQVYRWSELDFKANEREGIATPWPVSYAEIEPWYDYVEEFIGVSGSPEGLEQLPDGKFLPPMQMSAGERVMREKTIEPLERRAHPHDRALRDFDTRPQGSSCLSLLWSLRTRVCDTVLFQQPQCDTAGSAGHRQAHTIAKQRRSAVGVRSEDKHSHGRKRHRWH